MNPLEQLDTALPDHPTTMTVGSITFAPNQAKPCHCANCVVLEQEVERLRIGNAAVVRENHRLQRDIVGAMLRINELENKQFLGDGK